MHSAAMEAARISQICPYLPLTRDQLLASQNQNPFQTFSGLWRSLPRAAKFLLIWAALQSLVTIAYASAIFATPQASQEFVFPLLVR